MADFVKVGGVKINKRDLTPYRRERKVKDPPRNPNVVLGYEKEMNNMFNLQMNKMIVDLAKKMVTLKK